MRTRNREPIIWPAPPSGLRVQVTLSASAAEVGAMPEPQRNAFLRGVGLVMAAEREGLTLSEREAKA